MPRMLRRNAMATSIILVLAVTANCGNDDSHKRAQVLRPHSSRHRPVRQPIPTTGPRPTNRVSATSSTAPTDRPPGGSATDRTDAPSVLAISVDGLNPQALIKLGRTGAPGFWALAARGASTMNARTDYEQTVTLPNHASMFTGRGVDVAHGGHGWTSDSDTGGIIANADGTPVPSIFDAVRSVGRSSALFANKSKFDVFDRTWPDLDRYVETTDADALVEALAHDLTSHRRAFTFLHLGLPDTAGHEYGWLSPQYLDAVKQTDELLTRIGDTIDSSPRLSAHLTIIVTTDHGGRGHGHQDAGDPADYTIPFFIDGPNVPHGADLYQLNPDRRDPGATRPTYTGPQPIRNGDVANLAASIIGLPPVPASQIGASRPLVGSP